MEVIGIDFSVENEGINSSQVIHDVGFIYINALNNNYYAPRVLIFKLITLIPSLKSRISPVLWSVYQDIVYSGLDESNTSSQRKKIIRFNQFIFLTLCGNMLSVVSYFTLSLYISALINLSAGYIFILAFHLNAKKRFELARIIADRQPQSLPDCDELYGRIACGRIPAVFSILPGDDAGDRCEKKFYRTEICLPDHHCFRAGLFECESF